MLTYHPEFSSEKVMIFKCQVGGDIGVQSGFEWQCDAHAYVPSTGHFGCPLISCLHKPRAYVYILCVCVYCT